MQSALLGIPANSFVAEIRLFPFNFAPSGWAPCDGQLMPISESVALFSLLGTRYGGDGKSNFALPDLRGKAPHDLQYCMALSGIWPPRDDANSPRSRASAPAGLRYQLRTLAIYFISAVACYVGTAFVGGVVIVACAAILEAAGVPARSIFLSYLDRLDPVHVVLTMAGAFLLAGYKIFIFTKNYLLDHLPGGPPDSGKGGTGDGTEQGPGA
jgi:Phage Tail Collar Domain